MFINSGTFKEAFPIIDLLIVRSKTDREIIGIIDGAQSVIWHTVYFGVGDFEIYATASSKNIELLQEGNYITRPDNVDVGIIENISIETSIETGKMIVASGRFAKSILDRRQIYKLSGNSNEATVLRGNVESAARALVANNMISCEFDTRRNVSFLELGAHSGTTLVIVDEQGHAAQKQVSYKNLLEYSDGLLEEYGMSAKVIIDDDTKKLQYVVSMGADRSVDNVDNNDPVIFSAEFDNLSESNYSLNTAGMKNAALIGGEGEGLDRFYSVIAPATASGLDRRETWVDASSIAKKYMDGETEKTYTDAEYKAMLDTQGRQTIAPMIVEEKFGGVLNVSGGVWRLHEHYFLGDIVTIQDNAINKYANVRITEITEAQDENGYTVEITYNN